MTVSYEDARELVRRAVEPEWPTGTFCLDDRQIVENDEIFVFRVGAREYILEDDLNFSVPGAVPVVYKEDGRLEWLSSPTVGTDSSLKRRKNPNPTLQV